jgi:hypothetical protein
MSIPNLSDQFTPQQRREFAERNLQAGSIIKCFVGSLKKPKTKRVLIIGINKQTSTVGTLIFNTEKPKIRNIQAYQVHYNASSRDYLEWDSYLDCSEIHEFSEEDLLNILTKDPGKLLGNMDEKDLDIAKDIVANAKTIPNKLVRRYHLRSYKH